MKRRISLPPLPFAWTEVPGAYVCDSPADISTLLLGRMYFCSVRKHPSRVRFEKTPLYDVTEATWAEWADAVRDRRAAH